MYVDVTKPPKKLVVPSLKTICPGVTLLTPLSRKGIGPGLIIVTPNSEDNLCIKDGIPSPLRKWSEEGYTVVEIQERALQAEIDIFDKVLLAMSQCGECQPKDVVALVARYLPSVKEIVAAAVYTEAAHQTSLASCLIPQIIHLAGKLANKAHRTSRRIEYEYAKQSSASFAIPFRDAFDYSAEAVSHTRNLTFFKKLMNGPFFDLEEIWDEHTYFEFENRSVEHTMATMVDEPYVNHVPTMTGGVGRDNLTKFYSNHFVFANPEDTELELTSRTIGIDRVVDEFIFKFTHNVEVDWLIPGIPPTGKYLEIPFTAIVNIRGDRLYHEHIAWDQGTVLVQLGLIPQYLPFPYPLLDGRQPSPGKRFEYKVPVAGIETSQKLRDRNSVASNDMFSFGVREI